MRDTQFSLHLDSIPNEITDYWPYILHLPRNLAHLVSTSFPVSMGNKIKYQNQLWLLPAFKGQRAFRLMQKIRLSWKIIKRLWKALFDLLPQLYPLEADPETGISVQGSAPRSKREKPNKGESRTALISANSWESSFDLTPQESSGV